MEISNNFRLCFQKSEAAESPACLRVASSTRAGVSGETWNRGSDRLTLSGSLGSLIKELVPARMGRSLQEITHIPAKSLAEIRS